MMSIAEQSFAAMTMPSMTPSQAPAAAPAQAQPAEVPASSTRISAGHTPMSIASGSIGTSGARQADLSRSLSATSDAVALVSATRSGLAEQGPGTGAQAMMQDFVVQMGPETQGSTIENMTMIQSQTQVNVGTGESAPQGGPSATDSAIRDMTNSIKGLDSTTTDGFTTVMKKLEEMGKQLEEMMKAMKEMMETLKEMQEAQKEQVAAIAKDQGFHATTGMTLDNARAMARALEAGQADAPAQDAKPAEQGDQRVKAVSDTSAASASGGNAGGSSGSASGGASGGSAGGTVIASAG